MSIEFYRRGWRHGTMRENLAVARQNVEVELIRLALQHTEGNVSASAELLEMSRRGFQMKLKRWGVSPVDYKQSE